MNNALDIIRQVTAINASTEEGRESARKAVEGICSEIGATDAQRKAAIDALFAGYARPRISLSTARKMLGGVNRVTFWRWRESNRYGLGGITVIPMSDTQSDTYLDQILDAMKKRAEQKEKENGSGICGKSA